MGASQLASNLPGFLPKAGEFASNLPGVLGKGFASYMYLYHEIS